MATKTVRRNDLVEPELSYQIVGILYSVFNEMGPGLHEKYYQKAFEEGLKESSLPFQAQVGIPLFFRGKLVGRYFADCIVDNKIVVELKKGNAINRRHAVQLLAYLKAKKMPLGILAYFGSDGVNFKRLINLPSNS